MREIFFDSYAAAKEFAKSVWTVEKGVYYVRLAKKRNYGQWFVSYATMSEEFMKKYCNIDS